MYLYSTYILKLYVLIHTFVVGQCFKAISETYMLYTRLIHPYQSYTITLHIQVRFLQATKDAELPPQDRLRSKEQKIFKRQASQRQRINCFLSIFVLFWLFLHFLFFSTLFYNQWSAKCHRSERNFFAHLGSLAPLYNERSTSNLLLSAATFLFPWGLF